MLSFLLRKCERNNSDTVNWLFIYQYRLSQNNDCVAIVRQYEDKIGFLWRIWVKEY